MHQAFAVPSQSQEGQFHIVFRDAADAAWQCDCKGFVNRGRCSHIERLLREQPELIGSTKED